jgi:hypothetical protein
MGTTVSGADADAFSRVSKQTHHVSWGTDIIQQVFLATKYFTDMTSERQGSGC